MTNEFRSPIFEIFGQRNGFPTNLCVGSILRSGCFGDCDLQFEMIWYFITEIPACPGQGIGFDEMHSATSSGMMR